MLHGKVTSALVLGLVALSASAADSEIGSYKISSIKALHDQVYVRFTPDPTGCDGGSGYGMHAELAASARQTNFMSMILTAYAAGESFRGIWYEDLPAGFQCGPNQLLRVNALELERK